jgi:hypothetical protein
MAKTRKEGKKKRSRKSVLRILKMIENNVKLLKFYSEQKK